METAEEILEQCNLDPDRARQYLRFRPALNNAKVADRIGVSRKTADNYRKRFGEMSLEELAVVREWAAFRDLEEIDADRQRRGGEDDGV